MDRINRDNLFIIVSDRCGVTEEKIKFFESINCKGKVMFVANKNWRKDYILYLPYYKNESKIGIYMEDRRRNYLGVTPFDGYFDYTHFFNTGEVICKRNLKNELLMKLGKNRSR